MRTAIALPAGQMPVRLVEQLQHLGIVELLADEAGGAAHIQLLVWSAAGWQLCEQGARVGLMSLADQVLGGPGS
ncbi:hypothetical protein ACWC1D_11950 [Streptomyces sp. NPDC001478]